MPKRKAAQIEAPEVRPLRRSTRNSAIAVPAVSATSTSATSKPKPLKDSKKADRNAKKPSTSTSKGSISKDPSSPTSDDEDEDMAKTKTGRASKPTSKKSTKTEPPPTPTTAARANSSPRDRQYWLMKAEPDPRFSNGINVSFSISDLAACTIPEPWDGIRNYTARNNLRQMRAGDLAFFYHSNCKQPGIVGIMEIVREASVDVTAWDSKSPYYDPKDGPDLARWSVVHVVFKREFGDDVKEKVGLKELRKLGGDDGPLKDMQLLKLARLSVCKVEPKEWEFLMGVVDGVEGNERGEGG